MTTIDATMRSLEIQGTTVPKLGFGTWQINGRECEEAVRDALEIGYRHIDTARAYGNEAEVARGLAAGGVDRSEIFLTTKIAPADHEPARLRAAADDSLQALGTDCLDLLLLHWPNDDVSLEATLSALVDLRELGKIRQLGVSNFPVGPLRRALATAPVIANQVEYHPFLGQPALLELAAERDFMLTAYSPLAHGKVASDATLQEIAEAHGKRPGQVSLRWLLDQPNVAAIPKASSHERRAETSRSSTSSSARRSGHGSTSCPRTSAARTPGSRPTGTRDRPLGCGVPAPWRSGYAAACKAVYTSSILVGALALQHG